MYPFKQKKIKNKLIREFSSDVDSKELVWHRDRRTRKVKVVSGLGWQIQMENKLPVILEKGKTYYIPAREYHRVIKGKTNLVLEIYEDNEKILIPPPPNEDYRIKELQIISRQYRNRFNPEKIQNILDDISSSFHVVLKSNGVEIDKNIISGMVKKTLPYIMYHKNYFNSMRPSELARSNGIEFKCDYLESAQSPSYPSGHTTQAYYIAFKLSEIYPELKNKLLGLANMIAQARIDRGVHFPSDNSAGKMLALRLLDS